MKTILIPVDFSKESRKALSVGASLAKIISARLVLAHMVDFDHSLLKIKTRKYIKHKSKSSKTIANQFDKFIDQDFLKDIIVEPIVQSTINFKNIGKIADEFSADLIIMGSHGAKGFSEITKGSNTEKVIRTSNVPVLVIKENNINFSFDKILFVSDFKEESINAYCKIEKLSKDLNSQLILLYINLPKYSFRSTKQIDDVLYSFFKKADSPNPIKIIKRVNRYSAYSIEEGISNFTQVHPVDIISIPTHGRKGLTHFFYGSVSEDIANHNILPVLTVKI